MAETVTGNVKEMITEPLLWRKFYVGIIALILSRLAQRIGIDTGLIDEVVGPGWQAVVGDILINAVGPMWISAVWPNDPDAGILDYWRVALSGIALVGVLFLLLWWL